jgi:hypothetical protein
MHKYGILVYQYLSTHQDKFDVISLPSFAVEVLPTAPPIQITDKTGQVQYQYPLTVMFKIVEDNDWGQDQDNAINDAVALWNQQNPDRLIPNTLQLIFTAQEASGISEIFEAERQRLIDLL